jgi:hypothetical protein
MAMDPLQPVGQLLAHAQQALISWQHGVGSQLQQLPGKCQQALQQHVQPLQQQAASQLAALWSHTPFGQQQHGGSLVRRQRQWMPMLAVGRGTQAGLMG